MPATRNNGSRPVRLAVVGVGAIGRKHLEKIAAEPAAELVAIVDPSPQARDTAAKYGVPLFADTAAMLAATQPEGVVICTPTERHLGPAVQALEAGAHVLVEKPIAAANSEAEQLVAKARQAGRQVLVGHHRRYYPVLQRAKEIIQGGEIGALITVHGHWTLQKEGHGYWESDWRRRRAAGPVLMNLIHEFDTLRFVCGEIASIQAEISRGVRNWEKEDAAAIVMTFANGAIGTFTLSDSTPSPWAWELATGENPAFPPAHRNTHRFTGTAGALEFPDLAVWKQTGGEGWNWPIERHAVSYAGADAFARQTAHFCAVIRGEEAPIVTAADGARTLASVNAVFEAAETGCRVLL
ncbi:MAG TPA: Gfo/Idh/MocA family oxidoreductase [Thermohalobaculum sp.]|nr:Gfo/Idh/MocA family oxidoreductase [Thermohalobaculum sp.]